jgi:hypothetical protein
MSSPQKSGSKHLPMVDALNNKNKKAQPQVVINSIADNDGYGEI